MVFWTFIILVNKIKKNDFSVIEKILCIWSNVLISILRFIPLPLQDGILR